MPIAYKTSKLIIEFHPSTGLHGRKAHVKLEDWNIEYFKYYYEHIWVPFVQSILFVDKLYLIDWISATVKFNKNTKKIFRLRLN
jgi:hypothetical protein